MMGRALRDDGARVMLSLSASRQRHAPRYYCVLPDEGYCGAFAATLLITERAAHVALFVYFAFHDGV